ncbi:alanine--tRNA ligase [Cardinium endosymbiont of Sogatella furcifera]|uniref:alanine--tRNA ligase n=1 Tax=Cardinium endosymbiont of Sogatella furcifera TaxID=650378 RepID=UPI000E0D6BCB|nr:alanine--tRNA ligase [Cardinium endosymbiont of Sogatella furcifera]AXI24378.1 alanine--tRNA ligase [Cardinium endosymbiont of Sogatella furcifera]
MQSKFIREKFLEFFIQKGHQHQPAVPIIGKDDPSLLFVNAGMNPFKEVILGNQPITAPRVVTVQPCLRVSGKHNDLEEVGVDTYHHTLFEMLGNWSFGDYFKEAAIAWAWELLTEVYQLPKAEIYVTIFAGDAQDGLPKDNEAAAIWAEYLPAERILACGKEANFWEMGEQGPCGPCSEIHIDIRPEAERKTLPAAQLVNQGHPQVIEIWNLVFMEYNRQASGRLVDLPHKHIDTGMGFERLAMVLQGKTSTYDTDVFTPLIAKIQRLAGKPYSDTMAVAMRVIADHLRAVAFAIADGQAPAPTKAAYVIRRILRRAIRYGYSHLGIQTPFIYQLVPVLVAQMEGIYPNLSAQQDYIAQCIQSEETAFLKTLATGLQLFNQLDARNIHQGSIEGRVAFTLYDTYGFPLDLTLLLAKEKGLTVDVAGFQQALQEQKKRSQKDAASSQGDWQVIQTGVQPRFVGYDALAITTSIVQWRAITNKQGVAYQLVLAATPFYPEGGGQVADVGVIISGQQSISVLDVQKEHGLILHTVDQLPTQLAQPQLGQPRLEQPIEARVDPVQRTLVAGNHTATHLLQAALRAVVGDHVVQKGSLVTPALLRFDFAHPTKLSDAQIEAVEAMVNEKIRANIACIEQRAVPLETAKAMGAQALFGEKYGAEVRVIAFDPAYSIELCGGTHLPCTGSIGFFKIIRETAVASGIRRIEALTACQAHQFVTQQAATLNAIAALLKHPKALVQAVEKLLCEKKQLQKQLAVYQAQAIEQIQLSFEQVGGVYLLLQVVQLPHPDALQQLALRYRNQYKKSIILLAATFDQQAHLMMVVSEALAPSYNAHALMQSIASLIAGKGGGQPLLATARGDNPAGIPDALQAIRRLLVSADVIE